MEASAAFPDDLLAPEREAEENLGHISRMLEAGTAAQTAKAKWKRRAAALQIENESLQRELERTASLLKVDTALVIMLCRHSHLAAT